MRKQSADIVRFQRTIFLLKAYYGEMKFTED